MSNSVLLLGFYEFFSFFFLFFGGGVVGVVCRQKEKKKNFLHLLYLIPKFSFILCLAEDYNFFSCLKPFLGLDLVMSIAVYLWVAFNSDQSSSINFALNTSETSTRQDFWRWHSFSRLKSPFIFHLKFSSSGLFSIANDYIEPGLSIGLFLQMCKEVKWKTEIKKNEHWVGCIHEQVMREEH